MPYADQVSTEEFQFAKVIDLPNGDQGILVAGQAIGVHPYGYAARIVEALRSNPKGLTSAAGQGLQGLTNGGHLGRQTANG